MRLEIPHGVLTSVAPDFVGLGLGEDVPVT